MKWCASTALVLPTRLPCRCVNVAVRALVAHPVGAPEQKHGGWSAAYRNHHPRTFLSARSRGAASQDTDGNGEVTFVEFKAWWDENGGALPPLATRQD